jgi:hypothetical protein
MTVDITSPRVFTALAIVCIILGGIIGAMCAALFYSVSHLPVVINGVNTVEIASTQIDPVWGAIFILIMAATAFCIALTFRLVPGWVVRYYETREVPPFMKWFHELMAAIENVLGEKE